MQGDFAPVSMPPLSELGLTLPTPAYLAGLLVFGIVGWIAWRRGRKLERPALKWAGLAIMLYPYAVPQTWLLWTIGAGACVWLYFNWSS
ncbi:MAG: hypothetical protein JWP41_1419 [Ramlibacter sp.]|nr:hypothetical protein [Ramlibacter sp.]